MLPSQHPTPPACVTTTRTQSSTFGVHVATAADNRLITTSGWRRYLIRDDDAQRTEDEAIGGGGGGGAAAAAATRPQDVDTIHLKNCSSRDLTSRAAVAAVAAAVNKMGTRADEDRCDFADFTNSTAQLTSAVSHSTTEQSLKRALRRTVDVLSKATVEPCLSLYMVSSAISSLAVQNMNLEKACRVDLAYGNDVCDRLMAGNTSDLKEEVVKVQSLVAGVVAWRFPLQTAIPALLILFVGAWSDRTRKRKVCMLTPMVGEMVANVGLLLATHFMNEWSLQSTAFIEALPPALTGGWITMFMGMYSYMADITKTEDRTFRLGIVTVFVSLGTPLGSALSGILLKTLGYYGVFGLLLCLHAVAFLYGLLRLKDVKLESENDNAKSEKIRSCLRNFFPMKSVLDTVMVLCGKRARSKRFQIFFVMLLYVIMVGPLYGDSQVSYLYARYKFNFSAVEFSLYSTANVLIGLAGTIFCITVLIRLACVEDSAIGMLAGASRIAACFLFAFAPTRSWYYSAPAVNIFSHVGLTAIRSMSSKLVPIDEVAKLNSMLGVCEALAPSVYMPITSAIYVKTMETLPGAFYLFDAALTVVAVVIFGICYLLKKYEVRADTKAGTSREGTIAKTNEIAHL